MTIAHNISKEERRIKKAIDAIANFAKGVKEVERAQPQAKRTKIPKQPDP